MMATEEIGARPRGLEARLRSGTVRARVTGMPVLVSVTEVIEPVAPLEYYTTARAAGNDCFLWEQPDAGVAIVGVGVAWSLCAEGVSDTRRALEKWQELLGGAELELGDVPRGAGPLLMGGFAFDASLRATELWHGFPAGMLALPRRILIVRDGQAWLTTSEVVMPDGDGDGVVETLHATSLPDAPRPKGVTLEDTGGEFSGGRCRGAGYPLGGGSRPCGGRASQWPAPTTTHQPDNYLAASIFEDVHCATEWKTAVERLAREVRGKRVEKVVLARAARVLSPTVIQPEDVLAQLRADYPSCTVFAVTRGGASFVGATPERLVALEDGTVRVAALAGSRPRGADPVEDARLAEELMQSPKERTEHGIVVRMLVETLEQSCDAVRVAPEPTLMTMCNVQHLYTPLAARARPGQSVLDLVTALHPTPAVGGYPGREALELIRRHEGLDRGWYAGPVGWMDPRGEGEFVVGIRSALLRGAEATLFTGCGIMGDSDPEAEYAESELKLQPLLSALRTPQLRTQHPVLSTPREAAR